MNLCSLILINYFLHFMSEYHVNRLIISISISQTTLLTTYPLFAQVERCHGCWPERKKSKPLEHLSQPQSLIPSISLIQTTTMEWNTTSTMLILWMFYGMKYSFIVTRTSIDTRTYEKVAFIQYLPTQSYFLAMTKLYSVFHIYT